MPELLSWQMGKQAWIQDPKTANTMRFHFDPKSWIAHPMYFVDSGRPQQSQSLLRQSTLQGNAPADLCATY
jgi:hypothetical protein